MNTDKDGKLVLSLDYENCLLEAKADKAKNVEFSPEGCVEVEGKDTNYDMGIILNDGYTVTDWNAISVVGSNVDNASLLKTKRGYVIKAEMPLI